MNEGDVQLHNHKLSPWERLERWIGRDKEWVREERQQSEQQRQEEKGKERKPRDPAEAPKTKQEKEWEAAALPSLPTVQR
ncbi:hypothetical protein JOQ06_000255 [Pogonophryne albipinna]|uniref:Uncharacterized protein n=1 Tax=Pogonophryne albipinna TaxID=1090488 RepID=A0AAD6F836_9TELE|nr:hypothetical protein JOQ06_000255 [Pogonophryne albipinna]